jgi:hypothetical protein
VDKPLGKNDLNAAVPKLCFALEEYRRTTEGRVRTSQELLGHFFPHDEKGSTDRIFLHLPMEVRGPILSGWGIRGLKAALRDTDAKVESVVLDALTAGDIDHAAFEQGLSAETLIRYVPLASWWSFWRGGKLSKKAIHKALEAAFDLGIFDAKWFLDTLEGRGGKLRGTDVISEGLTKADLTDWVKNIHQSGDGTPKGILVALGWEKIVSQTANEILVGALDAMAAKVSLAGAAAGPSNENKRVTQRPAAPESKTDVGASKVDSDAPEIQVGEAEVTSLTDEGMIVEIEEEAAPVATASAAPPPKAGSSKKSSVPVVVASDDDDEPEEKTEVFRSELPRGRAR